jgi:hypothetical protein
MSVNDLKKEVVFEEFAADSLISVAGNMILCVAALTVVAWFYRKYSRSLGGKMHIAAVLPLIGLTVFLVIVVVKSSLALSLGLVGALSIVRFRTPIKEPEELGYLFLTIAIGLGFGAGFKIVTTFAVSVILFYLWMVKANFKSSKIAGEYNAVVTYKESNIANITSITKVLSQYVYGLNLTRFNLNGNNMVLYFSIGLSPDFDIQNALVELRALDSSIDIQMIEQGVNW